MKILCQDYRETFRGIRKDSFVYLDPPYMPISQTSSFTGYTAAGFGEIQHAELKKQCDLLNRRGIRFLLSNSNSEFVKKLYREYTIEEVEKDTDRDNFMTAEEAVKYGLIDEVITSR